MKSKHDCPYKAYGEVCQCNLDFLESIPKNGEVISVRVYYIQPFKGSKKKVIDAEAMMEEFQNKLHKLIKEELKNESKKIV
jgi:hypothetical protein